MLTLTRSSGVGENTLKVEVTNISPHGFWLLLFDEELFLSFENFPWFRDASVAEISAVELPQENHLYWPALDVDLSVESIHHPERFPLRAKVEGRVKTELTA